MLSYSTIKIETSEMIDPSRNPFMFRNKRKLINLVKYFLRLNKHKVYGRVACLGRDVFDLRYPVGHKIILINQQKVRVDLFMDWASGATRPRVEQLRKYILRQDIYPLIEEQSTSQWKGGDDALYFFMDSFSELSDQKFTHKKEGWSFCCHYGDIDHESDFKDHFDCYGLLPINEIEKAYGLFFDWIEKKFPGKKVYFTHFPTKLDERDIYKERGSEILRIMLKLQESKPYIKNVYISDELVFENENDSFPYHYSKNTYSSFLDQWCKIGGSGDS